ncbi:MAG: RCC1 repeat-containing protein [Polyangiaceae bacterium]|nr:RCC1 repeat-containing protein [Polyangiaceae bacterium]
MSSSAGWRVASTITVAGVAAVVAAGCMDLRGYRARDESRNAGGAPAGNGGDFGMAGWSGGEGGSGSGATSGAGTSGSASGGEGGSATGGHAGVASGGMGGDPTGGEGGEATGGAGGRASGGDAGVGVGGANGGEAGHAAAGGHETGGDGGHGGEGPCPEGSFDDDADPSTACVPWSSCTAGVEQAGTPTADRVCRPDVVEIAAGANHTCARRSDGTVSCWGANWAGRLGNDDDTDSAQPVNVVGLNDAMAITAGAYHTCALLTNGRADCWGINERSQLGNRVVTDWSSPTPVPVRDLENVTAIEAGAFHTCAVVEASGEDPSAVCWGYNAHGELGNATVTDSASDSLVSVELTGPVDQLAAGWGHTCALLADGAVWCWGDNGEGQLTDAANDAPSSPTPIQVNVPPATAIVAGGAHTCAILADSTVRCWGDNGGCQLGGGNWEQPPGPVTVVDIVGDLQGVAGLSAGSYHTCALLEGGAVTCWGAGPYGQLGDGTFPSSRCIPTTPTPLTSATSLTAGEYFNCALLADGAVTCWGSNDYGELGNGTFASYFSPVEVAGLEGATMVAAAWQFSCALEETGSVSCWGQNEDGQLGNGSRTRTSHPVAVSAISSATEIAASGGHACAVLRGGTLACWGENANGQLGDGSYTVRDTPVPVQSLDAAVKVALGFNHACALLDDGSISCWGDNGAGQLGSNTTDGQPSPTPVTVATITDVSMIAANAYHSCAIAGGSVYCWGSDEYEQLGDGPHEGESPFFQAEPVALSSLSSVTSVAVGYSHTCALGSDGRIWCWGNNSYGQLGFDDEELVPSPVAVPGIDDAVAVAAGANYTCAERADGRITCWGSREYGRLGDGARSGSAVGPVVGITNPRSLATGNLHACAALEDGRVACWGYNDHGEVGSGVFGLRADPEPVVWP